MLTVIMLNFGRRMILVLIVEHCRFRLVPSDHVVRKSFGDLFEIKLHRLSYEVTNLMLHGTTFSHSFRQIVSIEGQIAYLGVLAVTS